MSVLLNFQNRYLTFDFYLNETLLNIWIIYFMNFVTLLDLLIIVSEKLFLKEKSNRPLKCGFRAPLYCSSGLNCGYQYNDRYDER